MPKIEVRVNVTSKKKKVNLQNIEKVSYKLQNLKIYFENNL